MGERHVIKVEGGSAEFVYDDALTSLFKEGEASVVRASHVEPHPRGTGWLADMRPSGGPILGANGSKVLLLDPKADPATVAEFIAEMEPFETRAEALAAERKWLARERGL
jgi:hypothetical protein